MKNKPTKKKKPGEKLNNVSPEYDSVREQTVLLEDMHRDIKMIAEQHGDVIEKLDRHSEILDKHSEALTAIKSELDTVKLAVKDVDQRVIKLEVGQQKLESRLTDVDQKTTRIEQKLDAVTADHEQRLVKLETVS